MSDRRQEIRQAMLHLIASIEPPERNASNRTQPALVQSLSVKSGESVSGSYTVPSVSPADPDSLNFVLKGESLQTVKTLQEELRIHSIEAEPAELISSLLNALSSRPRTSKALLASFLLNS